MLLDVATVRDEIEQVTFQHAVTMTKSSRDGVRIILKLIKRSEDRLRNDGEKKNDVSMRMR